MQSEKIPGIRDLDSHCLFVDFDGTLVDIADRPDQVRIEAAATAAITALQRRLGGAIAIITGRGIADIDRYLAPLVIPAAGVHGQMRRAASGRVDAARIDQRVIAEVHSHLQSLVGHEQGLYLETKFGAVALHYRARPELEGFCCDVARFAAEPSADLQLVHGKMVVEVKFAGYNKGTAIRAFMQEAPFAGRRPVFAGDDTTDEDGFAVVNALGGVTIRIGSGATSAAYRLPGTREFLAWLDQLAHAPSEHAPL